MRIILIITLFFSLAGYTQEFADKEYYLVDSLVLSEVHPENLTFLEEQLENYHNAENDTLRFIVIDHLVEESWDLNVWPRYNEWVLENAQAALESAENLSSDELRFYKSAKSSALNNMGYLADTQGKSEIAVEYYLQALHIDAEIGDKNGVATILNNIGGVKTKQGLREESLFYFFEGLKIREEIIDSVGIAQSLNNIGSVYGEIEGADSLALSYVRKSLNIRKAVGDKMGVGICLTNLGNTLFSSNEPDSALHYYAEAGKIFKEYGNLFGLGYVYDNIGVTYRDIGQTDSALFYLTKAIEIRREIDDPYGLGTSLANVSALYLNYLTTNTGVAQNNLNQAQVYAEEGLQLGKQIGFPTLIQQSAEVLVRIYAEQNKAKEAVKMYDLAVKMKDSLYGIESKQAMIESETKYNYEKQKAIDDLTRDKEVAIEKEQKERQSLIVRIVSGGAVLLALLLGFIVNRLRLTKRQKLEIENQKEQIDHQHKILEETHQEITDSINYAKRIQTALLPTNDLIRKKFPDSFVLYMPKDVVAGDFYWTYSSGDLALLAAADCTGHGVPGAMVSVVCNNCLNRATKEFGLKTPAEILNKTRDLVIEEFEKSDEEMKDGMDISLIAVDGYKLQFAGANNPLWILRNGELIEIKGDKQPIGKHVQMMPFTNHEVELKTNDVLYIFSDGYADQFGGDKGKKMKSSNMKKFILSNGDKHLVDQKESMKSKFIEWMGDFAQLDDVCVIGVKIK